MDTLAKSYWHTLNANQPPYFSVSPFPGQLSIWHESMRLSKWSRETAELHFYNPMVAHYWWDKRKLRITSIDLTTSAMALRRMNLAQQLWVPRWITSFLPTGNRMMLISADHSPLCPRCGQAETHRSHVIRCPHPDVITRWQHRLTKLDSWLILQHTQPTLCTGLIALLSAWYQDSDWVFPTPTTPEVGSAFTAQQAFGISHVMDGFLPFQWAEAQHAYYLSINRKTTGQRWLARVIQQLWEIAWDFWRHCHKAMLSPDSRVRAQQHNTLDELIMQAYAQYTLDTPPPYANGFHRPCLLY